MGTLWQHPCVAAEEPLTRTTRQILCAANPPACLWVIRMEKLELQRASRPELKDSQRQRNRDDFQHQLLRRGRL